MQNRRFSGDAEYTVLQGCDAVSLDACLDFSKDHCSKHTQVADFLRTPKYGRLNDYQQL
jgi:hypothetical protein